MVNGTAGYACTPSRLVGLTRPSVRNANSCVGRPASALCAATVECTSVHDASVASLTHIYKSLHLTSSNSNSRMAGKWKIKTEIPPSPPEQRHLVGQIKGPTSLSGRLTDISAGDACMMMPRALTLVRRHAHTWQVPHMSRDVAVYPQNMSLGSKLLRQPTSPGSVSVCRVEWRRTRGKDSGGRGWAQQPKLSRLAAGRSSSSALSSDRSLSRRAEDRLWCIPSVVVSTLHTVV
ncbi:hypothetical protein GE09DRAFT_731527 [Coniochaeta sp. 2T2.1]|nr:hypothetical protein GE09DRAFT_731527 [Coniochaeta sp. 2T2.1]